MLGFLKQPKVEATPFSTFIRTASSAEKKRVYQKVMTKAIERQNEMILKAERRSG